MTKTTSLTKEELQSLLQNATHRLHHRSKLMSNAHNLISSSKDLICDLECQQKTRTSLQKCCLLLNDNPNDVYQSGSIRTFPTVHFPLKLLLIREEKETGIHKEQSVIHAMQNKTKVQNLRQTLDPPFDLLYGFRGNGKGQEHLSAYEMLRHWKWYAYQFQH